MRRTLCFILILLLSCTVCTAEKSDDSAHSTRLVALSAGKADCFLLFIDESTYLIDTGWERTYPALREALLQYGVSRLNGVFLTHCDKDHYGGLMHLAQSDIAIDAWYAAAIYHDVKPDKHPMVLAAALRRDEVVWLSAGDSLQLTSRASLRVLGPLSVNTENENNNSLVFLVTTKDGTLLFTGDMKSDEENALLDAGLITRADVLKVPFHGDNSACSETFVRTVHPQLALISTATQEEPDTPSNKVIKRLTAAGAQTLITQDFERGIAVTLKDGRAAYAALHFDLPDYSASVRLSIALEEDVLTLFNTSDVDLPLHGWTLYSSRGETCISLPENALLPANGTFTIGTRATADEVAYRLDSKRLWHSSRYDQAVLYDPHGSIAAVCDNGQPE